jgi:hypothetical protein
MALTAKIQYIHPTNWDGNIPVNGGWKKVILHLTAICSLIGANDEETDVVKLDLSELRKIDGTVPTRTSIEKIEWSMSGFNNVKLSWDRAPENTIAVLAGHGKIKTAIVDQSEEGDKTGDVLLTTFGAAAGSVYDITITIRLK